MITKGGTPAAGEDPQRAEGRMLVGSLLGIERLELDGETVTELDKANIALAKAERERKDLAREVKDAEAHLEVLRIRAERASAVVDIQRRQRDEVALAEMAQNAPPLSEMDKKAAAAGFFNWIRAGLR